jgi:hypothetical protein
MIRLPLVPLPGGSSLLFTAHEDDVAAAIEVLAGTERRPAVPLGLASNEPVSFRQMLAAIAHQQEIAVRFVPVPWQPLYWTLRVGEAMHLKLPFRADSLIGLVRPATVLPGGQELAALGIRFRPYCT